MEITSDEFWDNILEFGIFIILVLMQGFIFYLDWIK